MSELDIKQEAYFPFTFKIFGVLLIFGCFLVSVTQISWLLKSLLIPILFLLGLAVIFARYGLKVSLKEKTYLIYVGILGLKFGKPTPFNCIQYFFINEVTEKAVVTAMSGRASEVSKKTHKLFMKLDDEEKIHVDTHKDRQALETKLAEYKKVLNDLICSPET
ncbi:MAG: hypothetical protein AAGA85_11195 [Bacteroidota bacterium]